jgi:hypothetical protein
VFKRYRANYSLWPEQARPRRGRPLRFAIGSFALGVVCAAAYGVVFGFSGPVAAGQELVARNIVERGPVYASVAPPVTPAPARIETEYRSRPRTPAAKTRLPIIGSQTAVLITGDDGSGGDKLAGEAPAADVAASSGNPSTAKRDESEFAREVPLPETRPEQAATAVVTERLAKSRKTLVQEKREDPAIVAREESEPVREAPAQEAKSEKPEPAAATEPRANARTNVLQTKREEPASAAREESEPVRKAPVKEARSEEAKPTATERRAKSRKTIVEKKRERPAKYAAQKSRQKREEPARRAARRQDSSPSITEVALQALHAFTGGQGVIGLQGYGF